MDDLYTARAAIRQPAPAGCWVAVHRRLAGVDNDYTALAAIWQPAPACCCIMGRRAGVRIFCIWLYFFIFCAYRHVLRSSQPVYWFWYYFMIYRGIGLFLQKILPKFVPRKVEEVDALLNCRLRVYVLHSCHILHILHILIF